MWAIVHGTVNFCWGFFKWALLVVLIVTIAAVPYFYDRLDREIRQRLLTLLSDQYEGLDISVRSAQFVENEGIEIRDLVIVETQAAGPRAELLTLPEVFLHSQGTLQEVLSGSIAVREVVIRRPLLRMTRRHDATWSCSRLLPFPKLGDGKRPIPKIVVEDATIEVFDPTKNPSSTLVLRNMSLTLSAADEAAPNGVPSSIRQITGTLGGDYVARIGIRGQVDLESGAWSLGGVVDELEITRQSLHALPAEWLADCALPEACRARATFRFSLSGGGGPAPAPCRFAAAGNVIEGRIEDPRLPGPLTELKASFSVDNQGLAVSDLMAHSGETVFKIEYFRTWGFGADARKAVEGQVENLELDRKLLAALPDRFTQTWSKYLPTGHVSVNFQADYDGLKWRPKTATVQSLDASFSYHKFPYRLYRARGTLSEGDGFVGLRLLENGVLQIGLEAFSGKSRVVINGAMYEPLSGPYGSVEIVAPELELNDDLFAAMTEKPREVVRSLHPSGRLNVRMHVSTEYHGAPPQKSLVADVLPGSSLCYEKFPYPLTLDGGRMEMVNDQWTFRDFTARNDTGVIHCQGQFGPTPSGKMLNLDFDGTNLALEEELRDAFRPNIQRLWNDLRLRGTIGLDSLNVRYWADSKKLDVAFRAIPQSEDTSIEPVAFPYRLEQLSGELVYSDGLITIEKLKGSHGSAGITAKVTCRFSPDGSWNLRFDDMQVEQLQLDNELGRALPERLRSGLAVLDTRTPINLGGQINFTRNAAQPDRLLSDWNLRVAFHRAHLNCGVPVDNVSGIADLDGHSDGEHLLCRGELYIDSLIYRDIQVTQVTGPILIDDQQVLAGARVTPRDGQPRRSLRGAVFGGWLYGDGVFGLGRDTGFNLTGRLVEADLSRAAQELVSGRQNLQGKVNAYIELRAQTKTVNALNGQGNIQLRKANIYELPVMVSLLKILTIRPPDNNAFSESNINFQILGDHVYFPKIAFLGDAISLEGDGEMDADRNVNLQFRTRLGRGELGFTLLRDVLGGAGDQIILIHVDGPVSNPRITRQPLPAFNKFIKDLQMPVESSGLFPQTGAVNSYGRSVPQRR